MKKISLLAGVMLACLFKVNAQEPQFVSTEPQNKNVLIEELTGRLCGYCPGGQATVNQIIAQNPERVYTVNMHAQSSLSPTNYPNLNTSDAAEIYNVYIDGGIPSAVVNRSTTKATYSNEWSQQVNQQLAQAAVVNVSGQAVVNPGTRVATITVEAYYTANSASDKNYITVMMLQDSILGSQSGASSNPAQVIGGQYCHMHILRDVITETWGDQIAPTTAGTLITQKYVYEIPEVIGNPNGVEVDLNNIHFIAFVTEKQQGAATSPILNVAPLEIVQGTDDPIYPFIKSVAQEDLITCTNEKKFILDLSNVGKETLTSVKFEIEVEGGNTTEYEWTGELPSLEKTEMEIFAEIPFGEHLVHFRIVEANGEEFSFEKSVMAVCEEWIDIELESTAVEEVIKLELAQDRWGNQITWQVIDSNDEVIAKGGPYELLKTNGIQVNEESITIPVGECVLFVIEDNVGNGISGDYGEGYYRLYDSKGNLVIDADGKYGFGRYHIIHVHGAMGVEDVENTSYSVYPNPVKDVLTINGENISQIRIFNSLGQMVKTVSCNENEVRVNVSDLQNGMYFVNVIDNNGEMTTTKVSVLR